MGSQIWIDAAISEDECVDGVSRAVDAFGRGVRVSYVGAHQQLRAPFTAVWVVLESRPGLIHAATADLVSALACRFSSAVFVDAADVFPPDIAPLSQVGDLLRCTPTDLHLVRGRSRVVDGRSEMSVDEDRRQWRTVSRALLGR